MPAERLLAREGAKVARTNVNDQEGAAAADEIEGEDGEAPFFHHDVAQEAEWTAIIDQTEQR